MSLFLIPIAMLLTAAPPGVESVAPQMDSIRQQDLKADLYFLAGDGFRGRLTGTPGNDLASEFIASRFERLGLKRVGTNRSYYQRFQLSSATLGPSNSLEIHRGHSTLRIRPGDGFFPLRFSPSAEAKGHVVFVGFGISAPEHGHDDYQGIDASGGIVLALAHEPGEKDPKSPFDGLVMSEAAVPLRKALTAQEKGAVGILFVTDVHNHPGNENPEALALAQWPEKTPRIEQYTLQDWAERVRIPVGQVSPAVARSLLHGVNGSLEELARASEKPREHSVSSIGTSTVTLTTDVRRHVVPDRNVVGAIEGNDPKLKDEWVVISCHHDHQGADGDRVFNGADDNGSGTVGLLEIAEAYSLAAGDGQRPKRSILFIAFNSEERGLLGSWAFVEKPLMPLDRIVATLNMDMIGRNEEIPEGGGPRFFSLPVQSAESNRNSVHLLGYSRSSSLTQAIERANGLIGLTIKEEYDNNASNLLRRSDQWPFLQRGVPAVLFNTGLHPDYHTTDDRPERIRYPKMERVTRLVYQTSWDLAQQPDRPRLEAREARTAGR